MAPRTRNSMKAKKPKKGYKKRVRFHKKSHFSGKSQTVLKPPENYENLILYYLTKLKRLFGNNNYSNSTVNDATTKDVSKERTGKQNKLKNMLDMSSGRYQTRQTNSKMKHGYRKDISPNDEMETTMRDKAFNIVNSALEYGFANNVLEKRGNYFLIKNRRNMKLANRQPTPGPNVLNKAFYGRCKCHKCISQKTVLKQAVEPSKPKTPQNIFREYSSTTPKIVENQTHSLRTAKIPQPKLPLSNNLTGGRSKSCTNPRAGKEHMRTKDCKCVSCRTLKMKQKMSKK